MVPPKVAEYRDRISKPCELWTRARSKAGYGQVNRKVDGVWKRFYVHRLVCEFFHGPAPEIRSEVLHSCDTPACYEPSHLRWGSRNENVRDAMDRARIRHGSGHWNSKLTEAQVAEIRSKKAAGVHRLVLCREYGIGTQNLHAICRGATWVRADG